MMNQNDIGNQHGFQCPECGAGDCLSIFATIGVKARLTTDGCDYDGGDVEWDDDSTATCGQCDWVGLVEHLRTAVNFKPE